MQRTCAQSCLTSRGTIRNQRRQFSYKRPRTILPGPRTGCLRTLWADARRQKRAWFMFDNKRLARLVKRVREMRWDELRLRTRQEVAKRTDLMLSQIGARFVKESGDSLPGHCGRFFFEHADVQPILDLLCRRLPDVVDA